jgi:hypothetical protein
MRLMTRSNGTRAGLGLAACLLAGCATSQWVARDAFGDKYSCPADQVTVRKEVQATTPWGQPIDGYTDLSVGGCGLEAKYRCHNAAAGRGGTSNVCEENGRFGIQATDGSVYMATSADAEAARVPEKAAIASAARDIPCARASIRVVGHEPTAVEGCGQRITYKEEEHDLVPPPGYTIDGDIKGYRDVIVSRVVLPEAAPAPAPSATP